MVARLLLDELKKRLRRVSVSVEQREQGVQHLRFPCLVAIPAGGVPKQQKKTVAQSDIRKGLIADTLQDEDG